MQTDRIGIGTPLQKSYSKKKCPNCSTKFDIYNAELQNYIDGKIVWKREDIAYCRNCNEFFFRSDYDNFIYRHPGYFDYKLVQHVKEKIERGSKKKNLKANISESKEKPKELGIEQTELELGLGLKQTKLNFNQKESENEEGKLDKKIHNFEKNIKSTNEKLLPKADFFVRTSVSGCSKKNHKIIDFLAEVDVICSNGNVIKKSFPASYCEDCKLYFMYDNEYKRLRKSGVPLCSIYEYSKYIKTKNTGKIELKPESLLHSFGYNVGASEGLTSKQRKKILSFVINNGVMSKHEIINLLSYFVDFRKNDVRQSIAIAKWKNDIDYLRNTDIDTSKKVEVNSIRVINIINKHK